jgi:predicted transcriptional regulator
MLEQLTQLKTVTWDGNLISKDYRDQLVKAGLAERTNGGWNFITAKGVEYLFNLGVLRA